MYTGNKKKPLPTGWYHATCRGLQKTDDVIEIVFTVDRGEYAWQNAIVYVHPNQPKTYEHATGLFGALNMQLPDDPQDELLEVIIPGIRGQIHVTQRLDDTQPNSLIKYNYILETYPAAYPPDVDVLREKSNTHILRASQYGSAKLPIKPQKINS